MALAANLEVEFGQDGFNLTATVDGLGEDLAAISIPEVDLDAGQIADAATRLGEVDAGALGGAVESLLDVIGAVRGGLPVLSDLVAPLTVAIEAGEELSTGFESFSIGDLLGAGADIEGVGLGSIEARVAALSNALSAPGISELRDVVGGVAPGALDLDTRLGELGAHGRAIGQLVQALGGLMLVESASREISEGARLVHGMMQPSELEAVAARLAAWRNRDPSELLVGVDPNDPGLVDIIAPPILELVADIRLAADALTRGLGFGQANLVGLDFPALVKRLEAAGTLLGGGSFDAVRTSAERLVEVLRPVLDMELPGPFDSLDAFWELAEERISALSSAIEQLDPTRLSSALVGGLQPALTLVDSIRNAAEQVTVAVRSALESVRGAIALVDLAGLTEAISAALDPVREVLDEITEAVGQAQGTIETASDAVVAAMDTVRSSAQAAADLVEAAFGRIRSALDALGLQDLQATIESGIAPVTEALLTIQVRPVFDTANDAVGTVADVVGAVPLGLIPDDARAELAEAVAPIKAIDFQADVADVLKARMQDILDSLDTDVLGAIEAAYEDVIAFLGSIDPTTPLEELESDVFDPFLEELRSIDPGPILQPIQDVLAPIQEAIGGFDIGAELLDPIEEAIDACQSQLAAFDPASLIAPFQTQVDELRAAVTESLHIDELNGWLDEAEQLVRGWLERVDPERLLSALDAAFASIVADARAPARGVGAVGAIIAALMTDAAPGLRTDAFERVLLWIGGRSGAAEVQHRLGVAADQLEALHRAVSGVDLGSLVASLSPGHRSLRTAVEGLPEGSLLREAIELEVKASSPLELLGPYSSALDGYAVALDAAASAVRRASSSERSSVDAVAAGLREALRPLNAVADWLRAFLGRLGLSTSGTSFGSILIEGLSTLTPSRVLEQATEAIEALTAKLESLAVDGILAPARETVADVEAALAAIDIGFVVDDLSAIYAEAIAAFDALRPSVALGDLLASIEAAQAELAGFDPLGPVEEAAEAMRTAITDGAEELRPTVIFAPGIEAYHSIVASLGALDVRAVLDPLLGALDAIVIDLSDGLDSLAVSLKQLQDALPDAATIASGGGGSVSVSVGVG